jgi:hypothetical protein
MKTEFNYPPLDDEAAQGYNDARIAFYKAVNRDFGALQPERQLAEAKMQFQSLNEDHQWLLSNRERLLEEHQVEKSSGNRLPFKFVERLDILTRSIRFIQDLLDEGQPGIQDPELAVFITFLGVSVAMAKEMRNYAKLS